MHARRLSAGGSQCLCCDSRCACPCDDDVPFQIGCCSFFCVGKDKDKKAATPQQPQVVIQTTQQTVAPITDMER